MRTYSQIGVRTGTGASFLHIVQRIAAAVLGGYGLAWAASVLMARSLPLSRYEAMQWAVLASFLIYLCVVLWAFRARPLARMWGGILIPAAICAGLAHWLGPVAGRLG
ncbi:hypothetical protein KFF05_14365 [bacterium SCSIO 12827]|nr:hypothetical protein KFF05_14365 [bacterium SCSIO 12827]